MTEFFSARNYPTSVTEEVLRRVKRISRAHALSPADPAACERPITSALYHPHNLPVCRILRSYWHILKNSAAVGTTFCDRPLAALKKDLNLRNILVHSNLRSRVNSTPGTFPCTADKCKACPHLCVNTSLRVPKGHKYIKRTFTCQSYNLVYATTCQLCKMIYVGETAWSLVVRFVEHLANIRHNLSKPVAQHFNSAGHTIADAGGLCSM